MKGIVRRCERGVSISEPSTGPNPTMICSARAAAVTVVVWWSVARAPRSIPGHCSECLLCIRHQRSDLGGLEPILFSQILEPSLI